MRAVELVGPSPQCPLDDPDGFRRTAARLGRSRTRLHSVHLPYRYPISWALAKASVRFRAPSLTMADDR